MKGISSVIAVVLILMITVALSAMSYVWFTGVFEDISSSAGDAASNAASQIGSGFSIVSAYYSGELTETSSIQITNTGTTSLKAGNFIIVVSGKTANRTDGFITDIITPGQPIMFKINNKTDISYFTGVVCNQTIEIRYGDLSQTTTIAC